MSVTNQYQADTAPLNMELSERVVANTENHPNKSVRVKLNLFFRPIFTEFYCLKLGERSVCPYMQTFILVT